jgi:hypothetical protein
MVDSLPPSGTDPDNETIITNSNDKLSVALDGATLDVGSFGKVKAFETTQYLANFDQDSGDWTGIDNDNVSSGDAKVYVDDVSELPKSASVTADLTDIDVLNFRIYVYKLKVRIKVDGVELFSIGHMDDMQIVEISGLDDFGTNSTVEIEAYDDWNGNTERFYIDFVRSNIIKPESRKIELVDIGGEL